MLQTDVDCTRRTPWVGLRPAHVGMPRVQTRGGGGRQACMTARPSVDSRRSSWAKPHAATNTPYRCSGFVRKRRCYPCSHCPVWTHRAHAHCSALPGGCRGQAHFLALPEGRWAGGRLASVGGVRPEPPEFRGHQCPGRPYLFRGHRCPGRPHLFRDRSHLPNGQLPLPLNDLSLSHQRCPENVEWLHASKDRKIRPRVHRSNPDGVMLPGPVGGLPPTSSLHRAWPMP